MSSVKMIKLEDGDYVPEECCTFGRNFETGEMEVDDVSLPVVTARVVAPLRFHAKTVCSRRS